MEVKIGVSDSPRELVFNSSDSPEVVEHEIKTALTDDKGQRFLVQTSKISYVQIGAADVRRVGFGVAASS